VERLTLSWMELKYYFLSWKHVGNRHKVVYSDVKIESMSEVIKRLTDTFVLYFDFNVKDSLETKNGLIVNDLLFSPKHEWLDYLPNNLAWPLMSEKMKSIIIESLIDHDYIDWISTNVKFDNEQRTYYILKFKKKTDVLDFQKTMFVANTTVIIKPVFSEKKVSNYSIFIAPAEYDHWQINSGLYVSEHLKRNLQKAKCTGMEFSQTKTS